MAKIYVIHENDAWVEPLRTAFGEQNLPFEEWFIDKGTLDLDSAPPEGVFYNRMSASSHTRDHRYAAELTGGVLSWLEQHGRRVVNNWRALQLEISKMAQYAFLAKHGILTPRTVAAVGRDSIVEAAGAFKGSFITKHNRAGKGLGVRLFHDVEALANYVRGPQFEDSVDGVTLIQEYIKAPDQTITRVEFIGGKFFYAVRVDTSLGFELCPADVCQIDDLACPVGEQPQAPALAAPRFRIDPEFNDPIIAGYEKFLASNGIGISGVEFIRDEQGTLYTYDVNVNTNYNSGAEAVAGKYGMRRVAQYLGEELARLYPSSRQVREAAALRENLHKRKQQKHAREELLQAEGE